MAIITVITFIPHQVKLLINDKYIHKYVKIFLQHTLMDLCAQLLSPEHERTMLSTAESLSNQTIKICFKAL